MHERLLEAIAWWRLGESGSARVLAEVATESLVEGAESDAIAELAAVAPDENPFVVDALVERALRELGVPEPSAAQTAMLAVVGLCRALLRNEVPPQRLTRWVHDRWGHGSGLDLVDRLSELDDELDRAGTHGRAFERASQRVRRVAADVVDAAASWAGA